MKKTLVSALTTAIVVGAASTTFAAANPFEDVPADHWAYDAIAQLAADGVIEGYGDGTYRGDQEITRYEMAQMIARAMAKGGGDKALIDKLAAEFADELNNLGVRVAALEKKVDNMRWKGWVGYENYTSIVDGSKKGGKTKGNGSDGRNVSQYYRLRLDPVMTINKNWIAKARLNYYSDANTASNCPGNGNDSSGFKMDRLWVEGNYDNLKIQLGKIHYVSPYEGSHAGGTVLDNRVSGGIVTVGNKLKFALGLGRYMTSQSIGFAQLYGQVNDKFGMGVGFFRIGKGTSYGENATDGDLYGRAWDADDKKPVGSDTRNIWKIGFDYKFSPKWVFYAAYAGSNGDWEMKFKQAYSFEFAYNGGRWTDSTKPGSFGAFVAYRHLGAGPIIGTVYDCAGYGYTSNSTKGVELGVSYTFAKNIMGTALYFNGKDIGVHDDRKAQMFYGSLCFFF